MPRTLPVLNARKELNGVPLSPREWRIADLLAASQTNKQIAANLGISTGTLKVYLRVMFRRVEEGHPELRSNDIRFLIAGWMRCHQCCKLHPEWDCGKGI